MSCCRRRRLAVVTILAGSLTSAWADGDAPLGPSFPCPSPHDRLGQLICDSPVLSRDDLALVQTYQALRQQEPAEDQKALRQEAVGFGVATRAQCGVGAIQDATVPVSAPVLACIDEKYHDQANIWRARLRGAAAAEASRPLDQHLELQRGLQTLGLLPAATLADGVYGPETRAAIAAFQQVMDLPVTGLMGGDEAASLSRQLLLRARRATSRPAPVRSAWDDFQGEAMSLGIAASHPAPDPCTVLLDVRNPSALEAATRSRAEKAGRSLDGAAPRLVFAEQIAFLGSDIAAGAVRAFYSSQPAGTDRCEFRAVAHTTDIYGRDVPRRLLSFVFDRATFDRVVWEHFDAANLAKIATGFEVGAFARDQLREPGQPPSPAPPAMPQPGWILPAANPGQPSDPPPAARAAQGREKVVLQLSGSSTMTTRPFHVEGPWEFQWSSDGAFEATLHRVGRADSASIAVAAKAGSSSAYQAEGGDFFLDVAATEGWHATVVALAPDTGP